MMVWIKNFQKIFCGERRFLPIKPKATILILIGGIGNGKEEPKKNQGSLAIIGIDTKATTIRCKN
jgi:hypothetical protein